MLPELNTLLERIQAHLRLAGEFDPTYRPGTVACNEAAQLYLDLTALLSAPIITNKTVGGWYWRTMFHGEVVNSGFELGSVKPELSDSVPGVVFEYTPFYTQPQTDPALLTAWKSIEEALKDTFGEANRAISSAQKTKVRQLLREFRVLLEKDP
jgi:hypothetical protein